MNGVPHDGLIPLASSPWARSILDGMGRLSVIANSSHTTNATGRILTRAAALMIQIRMMISLGSAS